MYSDEKTPDADTAFEDEEPIQVQAWGDNVLDKIATNAYLLPLLIIAGAMYYFGLRLVFFGALVAGCVVWWMAGRRMRATDGKLILAVDVADGEITPYIVGRRRWQRATKIGRPFLSFRSASGLSVEIVQGYDGPTNVVTYPPSADYSDIEIASIPSAYRDMIRDYVQLSKEYADMTMNKDVKAWQLTRKHNAKLSAVFAELINTKVEYKGEKGE